MLPDAPLPSSTARLVSAAVRSLLRHFHRQSPIRGGSLLITIFGDSIAPRGGAVTLGSLISLAQPFELTERLVRTSVARLASDGWLSARRDGRRSEYRLSPVGLDRFAEATGRIYGEIPSSWDRQWTLLILPPGTGGRRQDVREELRWLGFGQVNAGVFAHPNWSIEQARTALKGVEGAAHALLLRSQSEGIDADRRLVASGWDLGDLARRYRRFVDIFTPVLDAVTPSSRDNLTEVATGAPQLLGAGPLRVRDTPEGDDSNVTDLRTARCGNDAPDSTAGAKSQGIVGRGPNKPGASVGLGLTAEAAFVVRTLLIHEYRKIHLQDPLLPPALLPSDWVEAAAYELTKRLYSAVFPAAERHLSDTASTLTEPLPPADSAAYARFGGLTA